MAAGSSSGNEHISAIKKNTKYIILKRNTIHKACNYVEVPRHLLCIEYPGIVDNVDKMVETLGGLSTIETAVGNYNRRLELRFRPNDIYCKPCWGDKDFNCCILVKITVQKPKLDKPSPSNLSKFDIEQSTTYNYQLMGITTMTFKFTRLCDFQYLPLVPEKKKETSNTPCQYIYTDIMPSNSPNITWLQNPKSISMPQFFPPPIFAKFNSSKENKLYYERYKYYEKLIPEVAERLKKDIQKKRHEPINIIGKARKTRKAYSIFVNFYSRDVVIPNGPNEDALISLQSKAFESDHLGKIKKLFEERPIWSKAALLHKSGVFNDKLKVVLPCVAYYCNNGPWRIMWCKFGYDPRLDPNSRIYQTFDYRIRESGGLKVKVQAKRSYTSNLMHYKAGPTNTEKFSLKDCSKQSINAKQPIDETFYVLKPNIIPPARQMFYQYCDLHIPEIQEMLDRLPKNINELNYHTKNGWLPTGFHDQCREISNKYLTNKVRKILLEEKEKSIILSKSEAQKKTAKGKHRPDASTPELTVLGSTIVIEDDDKNSEDSDDDHNLTQGDESMEIQDALMESDEEQGNDDDDIDLEAVEEINNIIDKMGNSQSQENQNRDSEDECDLELVNLYRKLILPNADVSK